MFLCLLGLEDFYVKRYTFEIDFKKEKYLKHDLFPFQLFCAQAIDNENESQAENAIEMEVLAD